MTPQQYDRINGLNALGGCLLMACIFGVFPMVLVLSGSGILAIAAGGALGIGSMVVIAGAKDKV